MIKRLKTFIELLYNRYEGTSIKTCWNASKEIVNLRDNFIKVYTETNTPMDFEVLVSTNGKIAAYVFIRPLENMEE